MSNALRALPARPGAPVATIDLVGWDIHRAIVDNVYALTNDEAHESNKLPACMARLMDKGVLGDKSGGGFFQHRKGIISDESWHDYEVVLRNLSRRAHVRDWWSTERDTYDEAFVEQVERFAFKSPTA